MDWSAVYGAQDDSLDKLLARGQVQNSTLFKVAQELQRRKEAERQDSLTSRQIDLQGENARESRAFREMQQQSLDADRADRAADRDANRELVASQRFLSGLPLRKKGSLVTPVEQVKFVREGQTGATTAAGADEHMAGPHFHFAGTQATENAEAKSQLDAERAEETARYHDLVAGVAAGRLDVAQAMAEIAKLKSGATQKGRAVLSGDARRFSDYDNALDSLGDLTRDIGKTGPASEVMTMMPNWTGLGADAKSRQSVIDRVKQMIGKTFEGGVLRKEDEEKYKKILPTIGDLPEVAATKLKNLKAAIEDQRERLTESLSDAGYDVSKFTARHNAQDAAAPAGAADLVYDPATKTFKKAGS